MDTAKIKTLQQVTAAIGGVQQALQDETLQDTARKTLEDTLVLLRNIQNDIILKSEQDLVDTLTADNDALNTLADAINQDAAALDAIAATVKSVSSIVGTLVNITAAAVSAGLL